MKIGVYYPKVFPLSMKIYADTIMQYLESKGCSFSLFHHIDNIPQNVDLYWDPRVGGGALPEINKKHVSKPIVATLHGAALFTLPIKENRFDFSDTFFMIRNRKRFKSDWEKYQDHYEKIITVSEYAKSEIIKNLSINAERLVPIHHAVDRSLFNPEKDNKEDGFVNRYILHVSVYQPKKNIDRIIQAYNSLEWSEAIPRLVLVAPEYPKPVQNRKIIVIDYKINREKVAEHMRNAYMFIFPSLHESFGLPILEAMACGVPVITSNVTGCPEIAGDAAFLVDPRNTKEIANAIRQLSNDESLRHQLIQRGLKRAGEFSWEKSANKHLEVFEQIG